MKATRFKVCAARMLVALALLALGSPALAEASLITILHVNDTHGHLDAVGPKDAHLDGTLGGLAKAATVIRELKAAHPNALLFHAGDAFQGDSYFNATGGASELRLLEWLGVDVMAVGNHELVFGPEFLRDILDEAFAGRGFPLVSANLDVTPVPGLDRFVRPSVLVRAGRVQVGVVGLLTPFDGTEIPAPAVLSGADGPSVLADIASEEAKRLRRRGADVVVCLSHLGVELDASVAAGMTGVDVIVGGHTHTALFAPLVVQDRDGRPLPIVQAGEFYEHVGKLTLALDDGRVAVAGYELVPVDDRVRRDPKVERVVRELQALIGDELFHEKIAVARHDLTRDVDLAQQARDTGLGNFVADALRHRAGVDIGLTVNGLVEDRVAAGAVVADDLFRVTSDGFEALGFPGRGFGVATIALPGAALAAVIEQTIDVGGDFFAQVSGMRYAYDSSRPEGDRLVGVEVGGAPLDPARIYTLAANARVAAGIAAALGVEPNDTGLFEFLVVRDWARDLRVLDYSPEGRAVDLAAGVH
jgi:5'-nucleotidase